MTYDKRPEIKARERERFVTDLTNSIKPRWKYVLIDNEQSNYLISDDGQLASINLMRTMRPALGSDGYAATVIRYKSKKINVAIHRLVAQAFIPNPDNKPQVNHIDGNKQNNRVENLEWVTQHDNILHAINTGLRDNYLPNFRYSKKDIHRVCKLLEKGLSNSKISEKTGVSKRVIRSIKRGKAWKHISCNYNIFTSKSTTLSSYNNEDVASTTIESIPNDTDEYIIFGWERK